MREDIMNEFDIMRGKIKRKDADIKRLKTQIKQINKCGKIIIDEMKAETERLKKVIHHMVACCGNPDCNAGLRNVIAIGKKENTNGMK